MQHADFIILLGRQRSGTNALRSVLESHPEVFCHGEVFSTVDRNALEHPLLREVNFFNFLQRYAACEPDAAIPDNHEGLFLDFLEYLRCFSSKRFMLIDVKYNTNHFLTAPYTWDSTPYLYYLAKTHGVRVLNITRKNYLRFIVSTLKAQKSGHWQVERSEATPPDEAICIDVGTLLKRLVHFEAEDDLVSGHFAAYSGYISYEYEGVFSEGMDGASSEFLGGISQWLGITNSFVNESRYKKQSYMSIESTISNFEEVEKTLKGTRFEYCLHDERHYRRRRPDARLDCAAGVTSTKPEPPGAITADGATA